MFALAGTKTDNSNYGGKTVAGYAMALKGTYQGKDEALTNLTASASTTQLLDISSISDKTVTVMMLYMQTAMVLMLGTVYLHVWMVS